MSLNGLSETGGIVEAVGAGLSLSALGVLNADVLQSEVDAKQDTINPDGVITDRAVVFNNAGNLAGVAGVSATEISYLSQVSSDIQAQLNSKLSTNSTSITVPQDQNFSIHTSSTNGGLVSTKSFFF